MQSKSDVLLLYKCDPMLLNQHSVRGKNPLTVEYVWDWHLGLFGPQVGSQDVFHEGGTAQLGHLCSRWAME